MKYTRLTKEQFESLHQEFALFLATYQIDRLQWEALKQNEPATVEQLLDVFSDFIWENVLTTTKFIEHICSDMLFLFSCQENDMTSVVVRCTKKEVDFQTPQGLQWLLENSTDKRLSYYTGKKVYDSRNDDIFNLIVKGAVLSDGHLYAAIQDRLGRSTA